ncbi:MAG: preprotein translocase subunit SecE [Alphaproteobacteria bacterium]|nr:preprotein translocase subunit SecE [Alphaproteobacteria bacterium]
MKNMVKFFREVRSEGAKVTWPTRSETMTTTVVVFIMISIVAMILTAADLLISNSVQFLLGLGK